MTITARRKFLKIFVGLISILLKLRFCEKGTTLLRNQIFSGDFATFIGLLRVFELYSLYSIKVS